MKQGNLHPICSRIDKNYILALHEKKQETGKSIQKMLHTALKRYLKVKK